MGSRLGDLKKVIDDIREKVDSICHEKCREYNLDEKKVFGVAEDAHTADGVDESAPRKLKAVAKDDASIAPEVENRPKADDVEDSEVNNEPDIDKEVEKEIRRRIDRINRKNGYEDDDVVDNGTSTDAERNWKGLFRHEDSTVDPDLAPEFSQYETDVEKSGGSAAPGLLGFAGKRIAKRVMKRTASKGLAKAGAKIASKAVARSGAKAAGKTAAKVGAKTLAKKLPFGLGMVPAAAFAVGRAVNGDLAGAGMELASGATAAVPGIGTAGSFGIDAYLADRDVRRDTGKGILGHGVDAASGLASKYAGRMMRKAAFESFEKFNTLYDRAKAIFESESGVNESVDGYCFDDYVVESKIDNLAVTETPVDSSKVYFGYGMMCESFGSDQDDDELKRLFRQISPDGKVSVEDLAEKDSDVPSVAAAKKRARELLGGGKSGGGTSASRPLSLSTDSKSGKPTQGELLHTGFDQLGEKVNHGLERNMFIPQSLSKKLNLPKNLGRLAGAGVGGLMFGPVGALGGAALANWMVNRHEDYKAKKLAEQRGMDKKKVHGEKDGYIGGLVGAGIGSLLGGPFGGIIGTGIGHMFDKKTGARVDK